MLELRHIGKSYGAVKALNDVSLKMENGLYGFLGENGAGKSTLIKILTCNLKQDEGEIFFDGKNIREIHQKYQSIIGYLPQESVGYPRMRVQEFMEYMAVLKGLDVRKQTVKEEISVMLQRVHLDSHSGKRFAQLSGGMKRRLLFAQAMLGDPKIVILDEPTAGLDPNERIAMRNLIARESLQRIVILATHIISDVECVANQIVLMKRGEVLGVNTPEYWLERVQPHVREILCTPQEVEDVQENFVVSNMRQEREGISMRVLAEKFSEESRMQETVATLDDVYLYFAK